MYYGLINSMNRAVAPSYPSSLKLFIDAGNTLSYSGSGTTVTDLTGNGNNCTLVNGTSYSTSNGGVFVFDGVNDYISTNTKAFVNAMTVSYWVKINEISGTQFLMNDYGQGYFEFKIVSGNLRYVQFGSGIITGSTTLASNTYYHLTFAIKAGEVAKLYVNGVEDANSASNFLAISNNSANISIILPPPYNLQCNIGMVKIFNSKRTDGEVLTDFNEYKARYGY